MAADFVASSFMKARFWFVASTKTRNVLCIKPHASDWSIWLNDELLDSKFGSPEEAAECANKKNFSTEMAIQAVQFWVPANLDQWRKSPPEDKVIGGQTQPPLGLKPVQPECTNRPWKPRLGDSRLN